MERDPYAAALAAEAAQSKPESKKMEFDIRYEIDDEISRMLVVMEENDSQLKKYGRVLDDVRTFLRSSTGKAEKGPVCSFLEANMFKRMIREICTILLEKERRRDERRNEESYEENESEKSIRVSKQAEEDLAADLQLVQIGNYIKSLS